MTDMFDRLLWAYQCLATQTAGGGGNVRLNIAPNERTIFLWGNIDCDDFASDRNVEVFVQDEDGDSIQQIVFQTPLDNERIPLFPATHDSNDVVIDKQVADRTNVLIMGKGDKLVIQASSLANTEFILVSIRALFSTFPPTVTTSGSGGTVTLVVNYNKVI